MTLRDYLAGQQQLVDRELDRLVPQESVAPATIHRAMRYSLFAGGKRIRPVLCLTAAGVVSDYIDGSLTCHKVFGEAMAILAGDALLTFAFQVLAKCLTVDDRRRVLLIAELSEA